MNIYIESGQELRDKYSKAELDCAWANQEENAREVILEKGGTIGDSIADLSVQQAFWSLSTEQIQRLIKMGPLSPEDF